MTNNLYNYSWKKYKFEKNRVIVLSSYNIECWSIISSQKFYYSSRVLLILFYFSFSFCYVRKVITSVAFLRSTNLFFLLKLLQPSKTLDLLTSSSSLLNSHTQLYMFLLELSWTLRVWSCSFLFPTSTLTLCTTR